MPDVDPIDWKQLRARCLNDDAFVAEMLTAFRAHAPATLAKLKAAMDAKDILLSQRHAHTLKGSAANLAAEPLRAASLAGEQFAKANDLEKMSDAVMAIEAELTRCLNAMKAGPPMA